MSTEETWFFHQSSLESYQQLSGSKQEERALRSIFVHTCKWLFIFRKILRHGAYGFTCPPEEACYRFVSLIKVYRLGRVWTRGTMASALTITPPRRHVWSGLTQKRKQKQMERERAFTTQSYLNISLYIGNRRCLMSMAPVLPIESDSVPSDSSSSPSLITSNRRHFRVT
jgi:hypothetical protein